MRISLCMIVKNEEEILGRCLDSVHDLVDEIIIVDTGSTDKTKEIAAKYTNKIYHFEWINDFSAARNFSFSKATQSHILWLDADDVLLPDARDKFKNLKNSGDNSDVFLMPYDYFQDEYGNSVLKITRERIMKRELGLKWEGRIHECVSLKGTIKEIDIVVTHKRVHLASGRNLAIYQEILESGEKLNARDTYYYAKELADNGLIDEAIVQFNNFLEKPEGWVEDKFSCCLKLSENYLYKNLITEAKQTLLKSLMYTSIPRAEMCCLFGTILMEENNHLAAIYWYELATKLEKPKNNWGTFNEGNWTWVPHLQLCFLYNHIGNLEKALMHNKKALAFRPQDNRMVSNDLILKNSLKKHKISVAFCIPDNKVAAQTRIRGSNIVKSLKKEIKAEIIGLDYAKALSYDICVVGKNFRQEDLDGVKLLKEKGKKIICDICEDILLADPICKEIIKLSDVVTTCSSSLARKVEHSSVRFIPDGWE